MNQVRKSSHQSSLRWAGSQDGFTVVEVLVGVAIMSMVALVVASGVAMAIRGLQFQRSGGIAVDEGRRTMPQIAPDLRVATGTNLNANVPISLASDGDLVINQVDLLGNGGSVTVTYSLNGTNLRRTLNNEAPVTIARHVTDAMFLLENPGPGPVYTVTLVTAGNNTEGSQTINQWVVYQRTDP
jgi:prepilin-type N-terminal cleavage/methylation domain-containing protein